MKYSDLPQHTQKAIRLAILNRYGTHLDVDDNDEYFSDSGMRYGYIVINERLREVLVCDCTDDSGDTIIKTIYF